MTHHYKLESVFKHLDLECVVILTVRGHRCGYVGVEKDSSLFGIHYSDDLKKPELLKELQQTKIGKRGIIDIVCWNSKKTTPNILFNVHGGITYTNGNDCYPVTRDRPKWWFGFDSGHAGDGKDWETVKELFPEKDWKIPFKINEMFSSILNEPIRSKEYMKQECRHLAEQIRCVESTF